jgi:hypothetical protein
VKSSTIGCLLSNQGSGPCIHDDANPQLERADNQAVAKSVKHLAHTHHLHPKRIPREKHICFRAVLQPP